MDYGTKAASVANKINLCTFFLKIGRHGQDDNFPQVTLYHFHWKLSQN